MTTATAPEIDPAEWEATEVEYRFPHLVEKPDRKAAVLQAAAAPQAGKQAFTFGWDTAFAIRLPDVNAAIVKSDSSPKTFSQEAPDHSGSVKGTFGVWQLRRGGDGVDLHMSIPIPSGSLSYRDKSYSLDGAVATIEIQLNYLPALPKPTTPKLPPSVHKLNVRTKMDSPKEPVVSVVGFTIPVDIGLVPKALAHAILQLWFNQNLAAFDHVFSSVNINRIVDKAQFKWLAPTTTSYAYGNGPTDDTSIFGVLCMTQNRSDGGIAAQLSPNAIPPGARSGFLISRERFLEEMVMPGLPKAFPGSSASDFAMSPDKTKVVNTANVKTKTFSYAGTDYHPEVTSLSISVVGDEIVVHSVSRTDIALGTYAETTVTTYQRLKVATKPDGSQTLVYEQSRPPIKDNATRTTAKGEELKVIMEIVALILTVILTILTEGAFLVIALIIIALLVGLLEAVPKLIANVVGNKVSNDSPSLALLVLNSTSPILWPGGSDYTLTTAGLVDSLQLGGNPGFA